MQEEMKVDNMFYFVSREIWFDFDMIGSLHFGLLPSG